MNPTITIPPRPDAVIPPRPVLTTPSVSTANDAPTPTAPRPTPAAPTPSPPSANTNGAGANVAVGDTTNPVRNVAPTATKNATATPTAKRPTVQSQNTSKARKTSLSSKIKKTVIDVTSDDEDGIEEEVHREGEDGDGKEWFLCRSTAKSSPWWKYYSKFDPIKHRGMQDKAACSLCFEKKNFSLGTISVKSGNTSGLLRHMQSHHRAEHDQVQRDHGIQKANASKTMHAYATAKPKENYVTLSDMKQLFKTAASIWAVEEAVPFSMFSKETFRNIFKPLHKKADEITNLDSRAIREHVMLLGRLAKAATEIEMTDREMSWTTDHWSGPNDQTYTTLT